MQQRINKHATWFIVNKIYLNEMNSWKMSTKKLDSYRNGKAPILKAAQSKNKKQSKMFT